MQALLSSVVSETDEVEGCKATEEKKENTSHKDFKFIITKSSEDYEQAYFQKRFLSAIDNMNDAPKKSPGLGLGYQAVSKDDDDIDVGEEVLVIGGQYQNCQGILVSFTEENMRAILRLNHHVHYKTTTVPRALIRKLHPSKLL